MERCEISLFYTVYITKKELPQKIIFEEFHDGLNADQLFGALIF